MHHSYCMHNCLGVGWSCIIFIINQIVKSNINQTNYDFTMIVHKIEVRVSSVTLSNSLNFVLLLDSEGVWLTNTLGGIDDFISKSLTHWLEASESRLSRSLTEEIDSLVDSSKWWNINSLSSDSTSWTNSCWVFSGTTLNDGLKQDFEWVLSSKKVNDLKSLPEDSDGLLFLTILSVVTNHEHVCESFGDWAWNFLESLLLIFSSGVWSVHLRFDVSDWEIFDKGMLGALNVLVWPLSEKFWLNGKSDAVVFDVEVFFFSLRHLVCGKSFYS